MTEKEFTVQRVADAVGIHRNTVLEYERRGIIASVRDSNNYRRFPQREVEKLKAVLTSRRCSDLVN